MFDVIFMFAVVGVVVAPVCLFIGFFDWMARENRVPFFWKWWMKRSRNKARRNIFEARVAARRR